MHEIILLKGNVPLRSERKGRWPLPPRAATRNGSSETEAPYCLRLAIRVCRVVDIYQDFKLWGIVPPLFP